MANLSTYKVDLNTNRPNPNNPLEVRKGDAPKTAFTKYNNLVDMLGSVIDGSTVISKTAPTPTVAYMSWIDTSANPALLKRRNEENKAWVTIGPALQAFGKDTDGTPLLRRDMGNVVAPDNPATVLAKLSAEPRYVSTIDLTGLSTDRYYPVWWNGYSAKQGSQKILIARHFSDDTDLNPFGTGNNQVAGLILEIEQFGYRGVKPRAFAVRILEQTLRKTVRNMNHGFRCANVLPINGNLGDSYYVTNKIHPFISGLYLRGGLSYQAITNYKNKLSFSREETEVEINSYATGNATGRWMAKSYDINDPFLGPEYNDFTQYQPFPHNITD